MPFKKTKVFFILPIAFLSLLLVLCLLLITLIQTRPGQKILLSRLSALTGYELKADSLSFKFADGLQIAVYSLDAKQKKGDGKLTISNLEASFEVIEIIKGNFFPKKLFCFQPELEISFAKNQHVPGKNNFDSINVHPLLKILQKIDYAKITDGKIALLNQQIQMNKLLITLARQDDNTHRLDVDINGDIEFRKEKSLFSIKGNINRDKFFNKEPLIALALKAKNIPAKWTSALLSLPIQKGEADAVVDLKIMPSGSIFLNVGLEVSDLNFLICKKKKIKEYSLPEAIIDFQTNYNNNIFDISFFRIKTAAYTIDATASFDLSDQSDPYLDLKVTSPYMSLKSFKEVFPTPLISPWLKESLYPCLKKGEVRFDLFSLEGAFSKLASLNKYENADALLLKLSLKNMKIMKNENAIPYTDTSARLLIENGSLTVFDAKGIFSGSVVNNGKMNINNLYSKMALYNYSLNGIFDLKDIKQQAITAHIPTKIKEQIKKIESISGNMDGELTLEYIRGWKNLKIKKSAFKFKNCSITHKNYQFPLYVTEADFKIANNQNSEFYAQGMLGKSNFILSGNSAAIFTKGSANITFSADINDFFKKLNIESKKIIYLDDIIPGNASIKWQADGRWSCMGEIDPIYFNNYKTRKKIYFNLNPVKDIISNQIRFNINYNPGKTSINLSGYFDLANMDTLNIKVVAEPLQLEDFNLLFKNFKKPASGRIRCKAEIQTSISDISKTRIIGKCEAFNISFSSCDFPWEVKNCNFRTDFSDKGIKILFFTVRLGENLLSLNGFLHGWDGIKGELNLKGDGYLNLDDLIFVNKNKCRKKDKKKISDFIMNSDLKFNIKSEHGSWKQLEYNRLSAKAAFQSGIFSIERCVIKTKTGNINLTGYLKSDQEPESIFSIYIKLDQHPAEEIIESLGILKNIDVAGAILSTEGYITLNGINKEEIISNLTGNFNILLENGVVKKSNLVFAVLNFLSLQNIIEKQSADFSQDGFYFNSLKGNMNIKNGVLQTDSIAMKSPIFNMAGDGNIDLKNEKINLNLIIAPMGTIDLLISKIPFAGYILTGKDKSMITFYLKVQGGLSKPKIKYIPFQHWPASIFGFIKRAFLTPGRLYKDMTKIKNKLFINMDNNQAGMHPIN